MLPLASPTLPTSHDALATALTQGLAHFKANAHALKIEGGVFPAIERLHLDLSGVRMTRESAMARPKTIDLTPESVRVGKLEVRAAPIYYETASLHLDLHANDATLAFATTDTGPNALTLVSASEGSVSLRAKLSELEAVAHSHLVTAAAAHGVSIKKTRLELISEGPKKVAFVAEITAKMFLMTAAVTITGTAEVDDELNVQLTQLNCRGSGMIGNAANALLKPHFSKIEGQRYPLAGLLPSGVKLRNVALAAGEELHLSASFGAPPS